MQMDRWRLGVVGIAAFVLNGTACEIGHSCTDIGCGSHVSATLTPQSGTWQEGRYTLVVTMDGRKQECTLQIPNDSPTGYESCGGGVRLEFTSNVDDFRQVKAQQFGAAGRRLGFGGTNALRSPPTSLDRST